MHHADLIIEARWVVPVRPRGKPLENHVVAIRDGLIAAIMPADALHEAWQSTRVVRLPTQVLLPGLVNAHTHAAMTLMRGLADDLPLMQWLGEHIWPAEAQHVSAEFVYDGSLLACAEMLRGGVTTFNDMYFFPEMAGRAALRAGMRAALGIILIEFPTAYASDAQDYLRKGLAMRDELKGESLLSFCMSPHAPYTVSDKSFEQVLTLAEQLQLPIQVHLHETRAEIEQSLRDHSARPLERLRRLGLLGPNFIAVHAVHLLAEEIELLAQQGCHVVHCPSSNLKLASGFAPVGTLLKRGVNIALGTDGAASNNRLDLFEEMRLAALLAKAVSDDAQTMPAHDAIEAATLGGAKALGLDKLIGSIEIGKAADLIAVSMDGIELAPCFDVASHLVYAAGREQVSDVWVAGQALLENRRLTRVDIDDLKLRALRWRNKILEQT